jgi:hypothetical protein
MERARADFHVVGLEDDAALLRPELLQRQDEALEGPGRRQHATDDARGVDEPEQGRNRHACSPLLITASFAKMRLGSFHPGIMRWRGDECQMNCALSRHSAAICDKRGEGERRLPMRRFAKGA